MFIYLSCFLFPKLEDKVSCLYGTEWFCCKGNYGKWRREKYISSVVMSCTRWAVKEEVVEQRAWPRLRCRQYRRGEVDRSRCKQVRLRRKRMRQHGKDSYITKRNKQTKKLTELRTLKPDTSRYESCFQ